MIDISKFDIFSNSTFNFVDTQLYMILISIIQVIGCITICVLLICVIIGAILFIRSCIKDFFQDRKEENTDA